MSIERRPQRGGRAVLALRGAFGSKDARELHDVLDGLVGAGPVTVDFRRVRLFDAHAVAALGRDLERHGPRVETVGLSEHHRRLMAYTGGVRGIT